MLYFSSRRRHTRFSRDWSSDVCSSDLISINNMHGPTIIYISVLALVLTYIYLKEAKLITIRKAFFQLYGPIRAGLTFSFLSGRSEERRVGKECRSKRRADE